MNTEALKEFGLNEKEAKVYLALLELGEAKAHKIAHKTGILRPTVYDVLEKLAEQGIVGSYEKRKVMYFVASDPEVIKRKLLEKQRVFENLLPELKSVYNTLKAKPKIMFFEGVEGMKTVFENTLTARNKMLRGILSMEDLYKVPGKKFMDDYVKRRIAGGYTLRVVRSNPKEVAPDWPGGQAEHRELRHPPANMVFDMTVYIYDDKVGLISTQKENFGMIIESEGFSKTMGLMFESLWLISK